MNKLTKTHYPESRGKRIGMYLLMLAVFALTAFMCYIGYKYAIALKSEYGTEVAR